MDSTISMRVSFDPEHILSNETIIKLQQVIKAGFINTYDNENWIKLEEFDDIINHDPNSIFPAYAGMPNRGGFYAEDFMNWLLDATMSPDSYDELPEIDTITDIRRSQYNKTFAEIFTMIPDTLQQKIIDNYHLSPTNLTEEISEDVVLSIVKTAIWHFINDDVMPAITQDIKAKQLPNNGKITLIDINMDIEYEDGETINDMMTQLNAVYHTQGDTITFEGDYSEGIRQ